MISDDPCRVACNDDVCRDVPCDHGAGGNDGARTDHDAFEENCIETNPDIVGDCNGARLDVNLAWTGVARRHDGAKVHVSSGGVQGMAVGVVDVHPVGDQHPVADPHPVGRPDAHAVSHVTVLANLQVA
jgi:hypothetical protein